jgi:hypothetical protein
MPKSLRSKGLAPTSFFSFQDIITCISGILILVTLLLGTQVNTKPDTKGRPDGKGRDLGGEQKGWIDKKSNVVAQTTALTNALAGKFTIPDIPFLKAEIEKMSNLWTTIDKAWTNWHQRQIAAGIVNSNMCTAISYWTTQINAASNQLGMALTNLVGKEGIKTNLADKVAQARDPNALLLFPDATSTRKPLVAIVSGDGVQLRQFGTADGVRTVDKAVLGENFPPLLRDYPAADYYIVFYVKPSGVKNFRIVSEAARAAGYKIGYDALNETTQVRFKE